MTEDLAYTLDFCAEHFDHSSELPPHLNAGNRLYGQDLARTLCDGLNRRNIKADFRDERWGWLVRGRVPHGNSLEVRVQYRGDHGDVLAQPGEWRLNLRMYRKALRFGVFARRTAIECDQWVIDSLQSILTESGVTHVRCEKGGQW